MSSPESPLKYLDQASLNRVADKLALDTYLCKEKVPIGEVRFLMSVHLRQCVRDLVDELPALEKDIVRMRFWEDLSIDEIANSMDMPRCQTQALLMVGLAKLRIGILRRCQSHLEPGRGAAQEQTYKLAPAART